MKKLFLLLLVACINQSLLSEGNEVSDFVTISNAAEYIQAERTAAMQNKQKLLWVLGSQWCHDSRSLAAKLKDPELADIVAKGYRVSMIDVGYLKSGFEFTQVADMNTFYATPTVLIIDPVEMKQLNTEDMHIWANAYKVSQTDTTAYFKKYTDFAIPESLVLNSKQQLLKEQLTDYVSSQEQRIRSAYKVVGPLLEEYKAGTTHADFEAYWNELAKLRMALPKIISQNLAIIIEKEGAAPLELPKAEAFTWEQMSKGKGSTYRPE